MSLHTDWTDAKKDSKTKFKAACKAKRDALEKDIKTGDAKARAKVLNQNLADLGIEDGGDDVDRYFRFKEDLGPSLDKLEKTAATAATVKQAVARLQSIEDIIKNGKLAKAFEGFAKRTASIDFWTFVTVGYKAKPQQAYDLFIKPGAKLEINVDAGFVQPLHDIAGDPAAMASQGPALLAQCRTAFINAVGHDVMMKFRASPECAAVFGNAVDVATPKKKVQDVAKSYRKQITDMAPKWKGITPDFRKPLLDVLDMIDNAVAAM